MNDVAHALREIFGERLREQEPMHRHTNFRIGGPARYYVDARTPEELRGALRIARNAQLPWFVLGGGSNTLFGDAGFDGMVLQIANRSVSVSVSTITAGAGAVTAAVAMAAARANLTGFEWAVSLPGTIGGAVRGNAGCFGAETRDVVERVSVIDTARDDLPLTSYTNEACGFRYRHSIFKEQPHLIVLEVILRLNPVEGDLSQAIMEEFLAQRRQKQPLERPSAGCLFKNVELRTCTPAQMDKLDRATVGTWRSVVHHGQLPTGWIIQHLDLKGHREGNVMISEQHGNFVINVGEGTAADVLRLIDVVQSRAREILGLELEPEVQYVGDG